MKLIVLAGAILLLLPVLNALSPEYFHLLPLGGTTISEIGIILGTFVALSIVRETLLGRENGKD